MSNFCNSMDCSTPGFPVLHHLPEFAQTHVHWVSDTIQPSHPLPSPSPHDDPTWGMTVSYMGLLYWAVFSRGLPLSLTKVLSELHSHVRLFLSVIHPSFPLAIYRCQTCTMFFTLSLPVPFLFLSSFKGISSNKVLGLLLLDDLNKATLSLYSKYQRCWG